MSLEKPRHIKYWLRCLKTLLPAEYTSTDLNRITLGFFCVSALDLLDTLSSDTTPTDRSAWSNWVYSCQLPTGGFRGSPATAGCGDWDPFNLPATFFAVTTLITLGDDLRRLKRREILEALPGLQREDGSFGEWSMKNGEIVGGRDMRFLYFAAALRWILLGGGEKGVGVDDYDTEAAVQFIKTSQAYDGGISEKPFGEAHAGMTYCALGALTLLGALDRGVERDGLVRWLVSRQLPFETRHGMAEEDWEDIMEDGTEGDKENGNMVKLGERGTPVWGGFNGRCNKLADTCYSFWVGASLDMLKKGHLVDTDANRRFLLEKTQHIIGGFKKLPQPGGYPDILHSYLGLAALALMSEEGLNQLDSALCISLQAKERLMASEFWNEK